MTALRRPAGRRLEPAFAAAVLLLAACGATPPSSPVASPAGASATPSGAAVSLPLTSGPATSSPTSPSVQPSLTPVPGGPSPTPAMTRPATTETEFGLVWDGVPASWPTLPGQSESEVGTDASANFVVHGTPVELAGLLRDALVARGWTVDVGSVLEDGSVVVDATGTPKTCKAEARFTPNSPGSNDGAVLIYYGAACPFG